MKTILQRGDTVKKNILIAAKSEKICDIYKGSLNEDLFSATIMTDAASIRFLDLNAYSAAFFFLPLSDENGLKLIPELCKKTDIPFGVIVNPDISEKVNEKLSESNVFVLKKPFSRSDLSLAAELLARFYEKQQTFRDKIKSLESKNDEIKLMSRTKLLLIEKLNMSENEAHSYILHRAMDSQKSIAAVCKEIISEHQKR